MEVKKRKVQQKHLKPQKFNNFKIVQFQIRTKKSKKL
jgi:hypothetical protein